MTCGLRPLEVLLHVARSTDHLADGIRFRAAICHCTTCSAVRPRTDSCCRILQDVSVDSTRQTSKTFHPSIHPSIHRAATTTPFEGDVVAFIEKATSVLLNGTRV